MSLLRAVRAGLRALIRKELVARELDDELRDYLERATQEKMRAGLPRDAAERVVRLEMGGVEGRVETLSQDVRYAVRGLRRNPGFTAIAALTLTLGIGANTAMFSVVNAVILRPLPYRDVNHLVLVWTDDARRGLHREGTAYRTITDWASENHAFQELAFFTTQRVAPIANDPSAGRGRARSALVSANLFAVLGVSPALGRALTPADEAEHAPVIVISHSFWQRWFAGAPDI